MSATKMSGSDSRAFAVSSEPRDPALLALLELGEVAAETDPTLASELSAITTPRLRELFPAGQSAEVSFKTTSGLTFTVDAGDVFAATAALGHLSEARDFDAFMRLVRPGAVIVDVGANFGLYALNAAAYAGSKGRVYAFEPAPDARRLLERNIAANKAGNVTAFAAAVGGTPGKATFHIARDVSFSSLYETNRSPEAGSITVDVVTLDEALASAGKVDLLKIDVEGAEGAVLSGARGLLARSPDIIVQFEFSYKNLTDDRRLVLEQVLGDLRGQGFALHSRGATQGLDHLPGSDERFSGNLFLARKGASESRLRTALEATRSKGPRAHDLAALALLSRQTEQKQALYQWESLGQTIADIASSMLGEAAPTSPLEALRAIQTEWLEMRKRVLDVQALAGNLATKTEAHEALLDQSKEKMTALRASAEESKARIEGLSRDRDQRARAEAQAQKRALDAESQVRALSAAVAGHEKLAAQSREKLAALRAVVEAHEANNKALAAERDLQTSRLQERQGVIAELQSMVERQSQKQKARAEADAKRLQALRDANAQLQERIAALEATIRKQQERLAALHEGAAPKAPG